MMRLFIRINRKARFSWSFTRSLVMGFLNRRKYAKIQAFVLFIGYPRSGHSLVAALLDAHPNIVISMEWAALDHLRMGFGRRQMFNSIEKRSILFTSKLKNVWEGYSFRVEGLWQGKSDDILVIGDKLAGQTSMILRKYQWLLERLQKITKVDLKLVHVIRNPFDTISTMARRALEKSGYSEGIPDLSGFSDRYFERAELVSSLKKAEGLSVYDLCHEDFIRDPSKELESLIGYLGLKPVAGYLEKCAEIVYESPHKSRHQYEWSEELKNRVQAEIDSFEFLARYSFNA